MSYIERFVFIIKTFIPKRKERVIDISLTKVSVGTPLEEQGDEKDLKYRVMNPEDTGITKTVGSRKLRYKLLNFLNTLRSLILR